MQPDNLEAMRQFVQVHPDLRFLFGCIPGVLALMMAAIWRCRRPTWKRGKQS